MTDTVDQSRIQFRAHRSEDGVLTAVLPERLTVGNAAAVYYDLRRRIQREKGIKQLTLDLSKLSFIDDSGGQTLFEIEAMVQADKGRFDIINASDEVRSALEQMWSDTCDAAAPKAKEPKTPLLVRLGEAAIRYALHFRFMISFLGSVALCMMKVVIHPKSLRVEDTISHMAKTGVDALPIIALISFLLGLIMAFMSSLQLQQFGANIYVASLVGFAMVSELGPIMTAVVVAGRSGSAFAAEIGTMKISEEVDALFVMGFDPTLFLAVPRIIAALLVVPFLNLFSDLFAISGGMLIGVTMLDLSASSYFSQTINTLTLFELSWGTFKSGVFAVIVAWTGCLRGFQARGGASAVGSAATSAVVTSIFLIVLFDSFFAVIRSYL